MWAEWETESSSIIDQLNGAFAQSILAKVQGCPTGEILVEDLQKAKDKIGDAYLVAKENAEYLSTLQDYLLVSNLVVFLHSLLPLSLPPLPLLLVIALHCNSRKLLRRHLALLCQNAAASNRSRS